MAKRKNVIAPEARAMDLVAQDQQDKQIVAQQALASLGYNLKEYDLFTYTQMAKNILQLHEWTGITGGKILRAIKENEPYGVFGKVLEEIGIEPRQAQRYMNIARRYGGYDNLSHLNNSKLTVLDAFSDPELEKFAAGKEVKGLTLDAIDQLTASQARERLREAEQKLESQKSHYKEETERLKKETERPQEIADRGSELTKKEKVAKAVDAELNKLRFPLCDNINKAYLHFDEALKTIEKARQLEGVTFPQLEKWAKEDYEKLAGFNDLFEQLDEALNYIYVDKGDGSR
jgi:hypothetical protein